MKSVSKPAKKTFEFRSFRFRSAEKNYFDDTKYNKLSSVYWSKMYTNNSRLVLADDFGSINDYTQLDRGKKLSYKQKRKISFFTHIRRLPLLVVEDACVPAPLPVQAFWKLQLCQMRPNSKTRKKTMISLWKLPRYNR